MSTNTRNIEDLSNATAYDSNNEKLGSVKEVFINDGTGQPDFVEVGHGLFGMNSSLVPLRGHRLNQDELHLAFPKDRIKDAPDLNSDEHLDPAQLDALYRHYGLEDHQSTETYDEGARGNAAVAGAPTAAGDPADHTAAAERSGAPGTVGTAGVAGAAGTSGVAGHGADPDARRIADPAQVGEPVRSPDPIAAPADYVDDRPDAAVGTPAAGVPVAGDPTAGTPAPGGDGGSLTRSEEQLQVSTEREATGRVRLRKYVVHDTETVEVPVEREEVRLERTPIDPGDPGVARNASLGEDEAAVTLHEDRVNVDKETVPVEKVQLRKETVADTESFTEDVAREEIDAEGLDERPKH